MTIRSLDEFRSARPGQEAERASRTEKTAQALEAISREAVRMQALTGDPAWDHFLTYLEAAYKAAIKHRDFEFAKLRDPMLVNDEEIARCRAKITILESRISTLDEIIGLPKFIKEHGELARVQIADMERGAK